MAFHGLSLLEFIEEMMLNKKQPLKEQKEEYASRRELHMGWLRGGEELTCSGNTKSIVVVLSE